MNTLDDVMALIEKKEYANAYELCNQILKVKHDNFVLLYRCLIDFNFLKKNYTITKKDLLSLFKDVKQTAPAAMQMYLFICDETADYKSIRLHSEEIVKAIRTIDEELYPNRYEAFLIIASAFASMGDTESFKVAIKYLNEGETFCEDKDPRFYIQHFGIDIELNDYTDAAKQLENLQKINHVNGEFYYLKSNLCSCLGKLDEALSYLDICEKYEYNHLHIFSAKLELLTKLNKIEEAIALIEKEDTLNEDQKTSMKVGVYTDAPTPNNYKALRTAYRFIKNNDKSIDTLIILTTLIENNYLRHISYSKYQKRVGKLYDMLKNIYDDTKSPRCLHGMTRYASCLNKKEETYALLKSDYEVSNNPSVAYSMGILLDQLSGDYDEITNLYEAAYQGDAVNDFIYFLCTEYTIGNPNKTLPIIKYYLDLPIDDVDPSFMGKLAAICLSGAYKVKKNYKKCKIYIDKLIANGELEPEDHLIIGKYYEEVEHDYDSAFAHYDTAHSMNVKNGIPWFDTSIPFIIHCLIKGYGINQDVPKAKKMILDNLAIYNSEVSNDLVYLYCYFVLLGDQDFKADYAYELLLCQGLYSRHELRRYMFMLRMEEILKKDSSNTLKKLKECLKYKEEQDVTFYKKYRKERVIYPD